MVTLQFLLTWLSSGLQALTFVPDDKPELVDMFMRWSMAYSKVLMCHLREDGDVEKELKVCSPIHTSIYHPCMSTINTAFHVQHVSIPMFTCAFGR